MKTYQLTSPPRVPGIYLLRNKVTGSLYIGRSMDIARRYAEWKSVFVSNLGIKSLRILANVKDSTPEDWEFCIIHEFPDVDETQLAEYEERAITKIGSKAPDRLLNTIMGPVEPKKGTGATSPKSVITLEGKPVSYPEAARQLGCTTKQLQKRLAKYRAKGVFTLELEHLKEMSAKYRPQD